MIEEKEIVRRLLTDEKYLRKAISDLKEEYFKDDLCKLIVKSMKFYFEEYADQPTPLAVRTIIENSKGVDASDMQVDASLEYIEELKVPEETPSNLKWFLAATEMFMRAKSIYNAIADSANLLTDIQNGDEGQMMKLVPIIQEAVAVGFDYNEGKEVFGSAQERFLYYRSSEHKVPFDLEILNEITNGGFNRKTLSVFMAETGVGKTLAMASMAAANLRMGYNVLYITLEISDFEILRRIDSNLLNVPILGIPDVGEIEFLTKLHKIHELSEEARTKSKQGEISSAKLYVKEYAPASAGVPHFRRCMDELRIKANFIPDVVYVDYINLCTSSRVDSKSGSYFVVKSVAEELRALMVENDCVGVTATQTNRDGYGNTEANLSNTAECLDPDSTVGVSGGRRKLRDVAVGDVVTGRGGTRTIERIFAPKKKECVEITTVGGRKIIASVDHAVWTGDGMKSFAEGLKVGDEVLVETCEEGTKT